MYAGDTGGSTHGCCEQRPPRVSWRGAVAISLHLLVPAQMGIGSNGKARVRVSGGPRPPQRQEKEEVGVAGQRPWFEDLEVS